MRRKNICIAVIIGLMTVCCACSGGKESWAPAEAESSVTEETEEAGLQEEEDADLQESSGEDLLEDMQAAMIANPWGETQSLDVATSSSGVDFIPPSEEALAAELTVSLVTYRYMDGTIEALYQDDENELTIRKSYSVSGEELAGDYNEYPEEWDFSGSGPILHCRGGNGLANVAVFDTEDGHYSITYNCGEEEKGLTEEALAAVISGMAPTAESAAAEQ